MLILNRDLMKSFRGRVCEQCHRSSDTYFAHLYSRGAGEVTAPWNGAVLCVVCHSQSHDGNEPTFERLLEIVCGREHCTPLDIEEAVYFLRRLPKGSPAGQIEADLEILEPGAQRLVREVPQIAKILAGGE